MSGGIHKQHSQCPPTNWGASENHLFDKWSTTIDLKSMATCFHHWKSHNYLGGGGGILHTHALKTYLLGGYLPCKNIIIHPTSNYNFQGSHLKIPCITYTTFFSLPAHGQRPLTPHWIHWFNNVQSQPTCKVIHRSFFNKKLPLFIHQYKPYPKPATTSNCFHAILHVPTR